MNKAIKAALLSVIIFPGLGHLMLKKYPQALFFLVSTFIASYLLIYNVFTIAMTIVTQIEQGEIGATLTEIVDVINQQSNSAYSGNTNIIMLFIVFNWIIAALDAYRLGKKC